MTSSKLTSCIGYISQRSIKFEIFSTLQTGNTDLKKMCNFDIVCQYPEIFDLFVLGFYGPVNNMVMSSQSFNSGTVPGQA